MCVVGRRFAHQKFDGLVIGNQNIVGIFPFAVRELEKRTH
jgi:hypothetical protein